LPALALTVDSSVLTAVANDYGFEHVFSRQLAALAAPGDVAVAITTSGKSPNVIAGVNAAREMGVKVIGLTGARGSAFAERCDVGIAVPSNVVARIQECHITIGHVFCEAVDAAVADDALPDPPASRRVSNSPKEHDMASLLALRDKWRREQRRVVWTNGVFDVLHAGHLSSLRAARAFGDVLVVGVNADESVRAAKGSNRPIFPVAERAEMLAALEIVDAVTVFHEATPADALAKLKPDVHCKGADYAPPNGKPIPEAEVVRAYGGRIEFLPLVPERSTTSTIARALGS
jgi:rfaE bifunctional protein nucleotidyltransferase chain/domain